MKWKKNEWIKLKKLLIISLYGKKLNKYLITTYQLLLLKSMKLAKHKY